MEVLLESEEQMGRNKRKGRGKRQRPSGPPAPSPAAIAEQTGRQLAERESEWLERLTTDPASFAAVELEVHEQARRQADLYVAGLLAKASEQPETTPHVEKVIAEA
jgi:hypothetical protein